MTTLSTVTYQPRLELSVELCPRKVTVMHEAAMFLSVAHDRRFKQLIHVIGGDVLQCVDVTWRAVAVSCLELERRQVDECAVVRLVVGIDGILEK